MTEAREAGRTGKEGKVGPGSPVKGERVKGTAAAELMVVRE